MLLVARFELILDAGTDAKELSLCQARLTDARERVWQSSFVSSGVRGSLPDACNAGIGADSKQVAPQPGQPWLFEKTFLVPRGLDVRALRPEIFVTPMTRPDAPGTYLRFTQ